MCLIPVGMASSAKARPFQRKVESSASGQIHDKEIKLPMAWNAAKHRFRGQTYIHIPKNKLEVLTQLKTQNLENTLHEFLSLKKCSPNQASLEKNTAKTLGSRVRGANLYPNKGLIAMCNRTLMGWYHPWHSLRPAQRCEFAETMSYFQELGEAKNVGGHVYKCTLPKTNSSPLKKVVSNGNLLLLGSGRVNVNVCFFPNLTLESKKNWKNEGHSRVVPTLKIFLWEAEVSEETPGTSMYSNVGRIPKRYVVTDCFVTSMGLDHLASKPFISGKKNAQQWYMEEPYA